MSGADSPPSYLITFRCCSESVHKHAGGMQTSNLVNVESFVIKYHLQPKGICGYGKVKKVHDYRAWHGVMK